MSISLDKIQNHQRILVTGKRSPEIINACRSVLDYYNRPYDLLTTSETRIGSGPIVLMESSGDLTELQPHIALIDEVTEDQRNAFSKLADSLPKAGTLVYNDTNKTAADISTVKRDDVYLEPYKSDQINAAASALLKRIGITEESFKIALN